MNRKDLFKSINCLCEKMNSEYHINCGGCCFVAAVIAEQLENHNIPYICYEYICPCHYVIKVSDRYLNRDRFDGEKEELDDYSSSNLYRLYYNNIWNEKYSKKWNLIVKTRIKSLFRKYENSRT